MSTAGKVLTVLVTLVAVVWVVLSATVAQLNRNGTKAVEDLQTQVSKLEEDLVKSERGLDALKEQTHLVQVQAQDDLTTLQARLSDIEKARSNWLETAARVKLQLADAEALVQQGQAQSEERQAEKDAELKARADAIQQVNTLESENEELLTRLTELRDRFRAMLQENRQMVEKLLRSKEKPPTRSASLVR